MKIRMQNNLPYVQVSLVYAGQHKTLDNVVLDTGSAGTIFSADSVLDMGLHCNFQDIVHRIRGIGGAEFVYSKCIDSLSLGKFEIKDFEIEIGTMDYGFVIDGIVGINFLHQVGACIDLTKLEIY